MRRIALLLVWAAFPLLSFADQAPATLEGWGVQTFQGPDDLNEAIELSKEKARLDLSANILTTVKVTNVEVLSQKNGQAKEEYKSITITKIGKCSGTFKWTNPGWTA